MILFILSCVFIRRSPGTDTDAGEIGGPLLLVGNVRRCKGLAGPMCGVHQAEISGGPPSPIGQYSHRSPLGSNSYGYFGCL